MNIKDKSVEYFKITSLFRAHAPGAARPLPKALPIDEHASRSRPLSAIYL